MKLLANENFPLKSIEVISSAGFDIIGIGIDNYGIRDEEVIALAKKDIQFERMLTVISENNIRQRKYY